MKKTALLFIMIVLFASCGNRKQETQQTEAPPKTPVEVVTITKGHIDDMLILSATSIYLNHSNVTAPFSGYITKVNVALGDKVNKGEVLFVLQSKESRALGNDFQIKDSTLQNAGHIKIFAPETGIITTLEKPEAGDYVLEGSQFCSIAKSSDLVFQVNVPFEYSNYAKTGNNCLIVLPNEKECQAKFIKVLTTMNAASQTQNILAKSSKSCFLPENLIVKVLINKGDNSPKQILPKSAVLSDEMMAEFWVMKLISDNTAVKVPVSIGNKNNEKVEILSPQFNTSDKIISVGSYGLPDTALVTVVNGNE